MASYFDIEKIIDGAAPDRPEIQIVLKEWAEMNDGSIGIGAPMASDGEVDSEVNAMIRELEGIRKRAKKIVNVR